MPEPDERIKRAPDPYRAGRGRAWRWSRPIAVLLLALPVISLVVGGLVYNPALLFVLIPIVIMIVIFRRLVRWRGGRSG